MFDIKKTLDKVLRGAISSGVAIAGSFLARNLGLELTPEQQLGLVAGLMGLLAGLTNFLKHQFPKVFFWL